MHDRRITTIHDYADEYGPEEEQYFYHSDHLGSSTFITDTDGEPYQFLQYLPFGESFISQRLDEWQARYTFSAKEKDEATGYHYFGARYYDSETSVWLSVDPLASKFPGISPYAYTHHNPVNYIDPWGLEPEGDGDKEKKDHVYRTPEDDVVDVTYPWEMGPRGKKQSSNRPPSDNFFDRLTSTWPQGILHRLNYTFTGKKGIPQTKSKKMVYRTRVMTSQKANITHRQLSNQFGSGFKITKIRIWANRGSLFNYPFSISVRNYVGNLVSNTGIGGLLPGPFLMYRQTPDGSGPIISNALLFPISFLSFIYTKISALKINKFDVRPDPDAKYYLEIHAKVREKVKPLERSKLWQLLWRGRTSD